MNIKVVKLREDAELPVRASDGAVGYDVYASRALNLIIPCSLLQGYLEGEQCQPFGTGDCSILAK